MRDVLRERLSAVCSELPVAESDPGLVGAGWEGRVVDACSIFNDWQSEIVSKMMLKHYDQLEDDRQLQYMLQ